MRLEQLLEKHFHYNHFRPGQKEVISSILDGKHTLAMLPTGTGKSLCYQLPGYQLPGTILIVSPLLSLMQDQVEQMKMRGEKRVIALNSFLSYHEKKSFFAHPHKYKFIFISPEMLGVENVILGLQKLSISLFVIDEAHCISQWGYDFRPDYLKLAKVRLKLNNPVTLALTATATKDVREDIMEKIGVSVWEELVYSVDRPNISMMVEKVDNYHDKQKQLFELIKNLQGPGIIYFTSKRIAEETVLYLQKKGIKKSNVYHGGIDQEQRILIQQQFINGQLDVICATSAFGMGINKDNIRYIIHYHMSLQLESYLQEIGRAGRDGKQSLAIMLYSPGDEILANQLSEGELPAKEQLEMLVELIMDQPENIDSLHEQEEWRKRLSFTEVQWRIVLEFLNKKELKPAINRLLQFIEERQAYKRSKIAFMMKWIHSTSCRRTMILNYFDESENSHSQPANCCDRCGVNRLVFSKENMEQQENSEKFFWKSYLSDILLIK